MKLSTFAVVVFSILVSIYGENRPTFPSQYTATWVSSTFQNGAVISKSKNTIAFDAIHNRARLDVWGVDRSEIYRGDLQQYYLVRRIEKKNLTMCVEVKTPSSIPWTVEVPVSVSFKEYVTINGISCSHWEDNSFSIYVNKETGLPVRVMQGTPKSYTKLDFLSFTADAISESAFELPIMNCQQAVAPGGSEMMNREDLENYLSFKPHSSQAPPASPAVPSNGKRQVNPADIVAIGTKIWQVVVDNKPNSTVNTLVNAVIPNGASFGDMSGWNQYTWQPWEWLWKNGFGMTVVDYKWTFDWQCQGTYGPQSVGQYIQNAGAFPISVDVAWGYNVDVEAQILAPANIGSQSQPIAEITVWQTMKISTVLKDNSQSCKVNLNGDCTNALLFCDQYSNSF